MRLCRVVGRVVVTARHQVLDGHTILAVSGEPGRGDLSVPMQLAVDAVGAGEGSEVMVSESGIAGGQVSAMRHPPLRSVIVGIVD